MPIEPSNGKRRPDFLLQSRESEDQWVVEIKFLRGGHLPEGAVHQLVAHQKIQGAARGLLVTNARVSASLRKELVEPLGLMIWDEAELTRVLERHPDLAERFGIGAGVTPCYTAGRTFLRSVRLRHFRGIEHLTFEPARPTTLFVGLNGAGKTAVLEAVAALLSWPAKRLFQAGGNGRQLVDSDIAEGSSGGSVGIEMVLEGLPTSWSVTKSRAGSSEASLESLNRSMLQIRDALADGSEAPSPVFVYYPVNRAFLDIPKRIRKRHVFDQATAYDDALIVGRRDFRLFFEWFREREDLENQQRAREGTEWRDHQLDSVRRAIYSLLPGFSDLRIQREPLRMLVRKQGLDLQVGQLSDGEKCLMALAGDLARRLAIANPGAAEPLQGAGIVLVDEIDLHLHPKWQRAVIPTLEKTFPNCSWLVTTHSPQVIAHVRRDALKIMWDGKAIESKPYTEGRDANSILSEIMDLSVHPEAVDQALRAIGELVDAGDFEGARSKLDELALKMGENDPEIISQRSMIDFLAEPLN